MLIYLVGAIIGTYNLFKTAAVGEFLPEEAAEAAPLNKKHRFANEGWHGAIERKPIKFTILALVAVAIGGVVQIIPVSIVFFHF